MIKNELSKLNNDNLRIESRVDDYEFEFEIEHFEENIIS